MGVPPAGPRTRDPVETRLESPLEAPGSVASPVRTPAPGGTPDAGDPVLAALSTEVARLAGVSQADRGLTPGGTRRTVEGHAPGLAPSSTHAGTCPSLAGCP